MPRRNLKQWFRELRRRHVLRTSAIYVAAAWALIQVADTTFPIFDLPPVYTRYVTVALAAGFPVVVLLSWIFDIVHGVPTVTEPLPGETGPRPAEEPAYTITESTPDRSIAVMPFVNVSNDPDNEYFSNGIAEELLSLLSALPDLKVAARTSSFAFKDKKVDVREIADRLGVRHVLDGSVRRVADRVRISAQLIDARSGYQLWSNRFDRELNDIFAVQDEIASSIVHALNDTLDEYHPEPVAVRDHVPTANIEAYQIYLRGLYLWQRRGETAIRGAIAALEQAVNMDPAFTDAISLLAIAHAALHEYSGEDRELGFSIATPLAQQAIELDPGSGKPLAVLGYMAVRRWDWANADKWFRQALALEPGEPLVHQWYSNLLNDLGYREQAQSHAMTAYQIDRLSPQANNTLALAFLVLGRDEAARKHVAVAREFGLGSPVPDYVDYIGHLRRRDHAAAVQVMNGLLVRRKADTAWVEPVVAAVLDDSKTPAARQALSQAVDNATVTSSMALMQYTLLGQSDEIYEMANGQVEDHTLVHLWLLLPECAAVREDPRFLQLMARMGIVDHWRKNGWPAFVEPLRANYESARASDAGR